MRVVAETLLRLCLVQYGMTRSLGALQHGVLAVEILL